MKRAKPNSPWEEPQGRPTSRDDYPMETVMRIIREQERRPMRPAEAAKLDAEIRAYGAERAKKLDLKERDIVRIIHESRARRRTL